MRSSLLDAASRLFRQAGLGGASIGQIAAAADAFPSQITYYFRTKEALFVEAACRDVLHAARAAEALAGAQTTPQDYARVLVESVMNAEAVGFFVEALTLTRRRPDLAPLVERTVERLRNEGMRAYAGQMAARGWRSRVDPDIIARRFWTLAIGVTLQGHAAGRAPGQMITEMMQLIGGMIDGPVGARDAPPRLRLASPGG